MAFLGMSTPSETARVNFLREYVGWILIYRSDDKFKNFNFLYLLSSRINQLSLPANYSVDLYDLDGFFDDIIDDMRVWLISEYFTDRLSYTSTFSTFSKEDYFIYLFEEYLSSKTASKTLSGRTLAIEEDRVNYGSWGFSQHFNANHRLTAEGLFINKLHYAVRLICSKSSSLCSVHGRYDPSIIKEYIDKGIIAVSCI